ncbi:hypothetical protein BU24DRAFT_112722 [Aaosphaeria arxii CBS 175.79]|uniref:Uncharacterized protein n=1 Tax=Aaosphaeria arxii CBS 175.79 TaxID=1450172 RepID=A0A6A5Y0W5_9PLEO|nr:uncharacterized protein BU24DRAFT_112722 [Aaosphaeria arxii CBS 175.79]KAF2019112.1 hypothetical protein BU24DRAFT_112722 [Aaosphaeria arxii CBS 175.79]
MTNVHLYMYEIKRSLVLVLMSPFPFFVFWKKGVLDIRRCTTMYERLVTVSVYVQINYICTHSADLSLDVGCMMKGTMCVFQIVV